jgi:hypothetical protein
VRCATRSEAIERIEAHRLLDERLRRSLVADISNASSTQVPVIALAFDGDGVEVGAWRWSPPQPKALGFRVDEEQLFARHLADIVRPLPGETVTVWMERAAAWAATKRGEEHHAQVILDRVKEETLRFFTLGWMTAWGANACPRIIVPHKLGASLMATSCGTDPIATRCAPWSAYVIEIPPELVRIEVDGQVTSFDSIGVWRDFEGKSYINVYSRTSDAAFGGELLFPVNDFADIEDAWDVDATAIKRATECLQRLVLCVELEMCEPSNVKAPRAPRDKKRKDGPAPPTNAHRLVREVRVDCREAIRDYIAGTRRNAPKVSWLTKGHYRWVAHGPRWSRTRWQHIEPFWNNRDAPVVMRPHRLPEEP